MSDYQRMRNREGKKDNYNPAEIATVTSSGKEIAAQGVGEYRDIPLIAPFGIRWNPPAGTNIELIKNWSMGKAVVAVGTVVDKEIPPGEIELYSLGGAKLHLKNDGTVIINDHFKINPDGTTERV